MAKVKETTEVETVERKVIVVELTLQEFEKLNQFVRAYGASYTDYKSELQPLWSSACHVVSDVTRQLES